MAARKALLTTSPSLLEVYRLSDSKILITKQCHLSSVPAAPAVCSSVPVYLYPSGELSRVESNWEAAAVSIMMLQQRKCIYMTVCVFSLIARTGISLGPPPLCMIILPLYLCC